MTTVVSRTPRGGVGKTAAAAGEGRAVASGGRSGFRTKHGSVTGVVVVPLWDRFGTGARA
jgi:hypothetical protein